MDLKRVTLIKDGEIVCEPMPEVNCVAGRTVKKRVTVQKEVRGKAKNVKEVRYAFAVGEENVEIPEEVSAKMLKSGGKNIFRDVIELRLGVDCCRDDVEGFTANVVRVGDYGSGKYAECMLGGEKIFIPVDENFAAERIKVGFNWNGVSVYDKDFDIRLV